MNAREIAYALGGVVTGRDSLLAPGPNHAAADRSMSVRLLPNDNILVHSFAGDDWLECDQYVRNMLGIGDAPRKTFVPRQDTSFDDTDVAREDRARKLWDESHDARGWLPEKYLHEDRGGLEIPEGDIVRYHSNCPFGANTRAQCMLTAMRDIATGRIVGVQRTALNDDGTKVGRRMLGRSRNTAIMIDEDDDSETLTIGEGFETCLTAHQLGERPVWALGSVGAIAKFPVLKGVCKLIILMEAGEPSERAAKACGDRWRLAGRQVVLRRPKVGSDLNDAFREMGASA